MQKTLRQKQAENTKNNLLKTALKLFSEKGVKDSTVKEIANAAGVTDGLIYHYFSSKEDLLKTVMETYTLNHSLREILLEIDTSHPLEHQLQLYFDSLFKLLYEFEPFLVMCFGEAQRNPEIREYVRSIIHQGIEQLMQHVSKQTSVNPALLQVATHNLQISVFMYFLMQDRFQHRPEHRSQYIKETITHYTYVIREMGIKEKRI